MSEVWDAQDARWESVQTAIRRSGFIVHKDGTFTRTPKVRLTCKQCAEKFVVNFASWQRGEGKFCSAKCFGESRKK